MPQGDLVWYYSSPVMGIHRSHRRMDRGVFSQLKTLHGILPTEHLLSDSPQKIQL